MTTATGFLLRVSLSDNGSMPRSGSFTGCPDIIPAGTTAISSKDLISSYGSVTDRPLTQGLTNYIYVRAKNMNATALTQNVYLFQVDGSLVLSPQLWYKVDHLVGYDVKKQGATGTPNDPKIVAELQQTITAQSGQITVTNGFTWAPDNTNHHCLVAVVADSWDDVLAELPPGGSMDALGTWIYNNPSLGWHNVNIQPITTQVYEAPTAYEHTAKIDEDITFTIIAQNVPVGAKVSFSSNTSTQSGQVIGQDWTTVPAPAGGGTINPDFEVGQTITVNAGYKGIFTYRTDFNGLPYPANFKMHMKASKAITPPAAASMAKRTRFVEATGDDGATADDGAQAQDNLFQSFHRSHSAGALFRDANGNDLGTGIEGYRKMMAMSWSDDDGDMEDSIVVVLGSHTTTPVQSS